MYEVCDAAIIIMQNNTFRKPLDTEQVTSENTESKFRLNFSVIIESYFKTVLSSAIGFIPGLLFLQGKNLFGFLKTTRSANYNGFPSNTIFV